MLIVKNRVLFVFVLLPSFPVSKACVFQILAVRAAPSNSLKLQFFPLPTTFFFFFFATSENRFLSFAFNFEIRFIHRMFTEWPGMELDAIHIKTILLSTAGVSPEVGCSDLFRDLSGAEPHSVEP